jgi:hypothetical protein
MRNGITAIVLGVVLDGLVLAHAVFAQNPPPPGSGQTRGHEPGDTHARHMRAMHGTAASIPTMPGQDAFGAIAEIVRLLDADPSTDWAKVDLERLRQHLIAMNLVVLGSAVTQTPVPGGLAMEITGAGRTEEAIRALVVPHAAELDRLPSFAAKTDSIPGGVRLTVLAKNPDDAKAVARIRGLGFAGLLTEGAHHQPHHLAMARGQALGHGH